MDKEKTLRKLKQEIEEVREKFGVEFAEVKHGEWESRSETMPLFRCSICKASNLFKCGSNVFSNYCPNCGAGMRRVNDG